jgi:subfamily B ATP-binding cassette protein MsbA
MGIATKSANSNRQLYARLLGYLYPYWRILALAILGMMVIAATEPVLPAIMKYLLDNGLRASDQRLVWAIPIGIVLLFAVRGIFSFCTSYLMTWLSAQIITDVQRALFSKMLLLPLRVFHEQSAGKLISRVISDPGNLAASVTTVLVTAVRETFTAIALFGYLIYLDLQLTLLASLVGPLVALIVRGFGRRMRAASRISVEAGRYLFHCIEESANGIKVVKIYGAQAHQIARFFRDTERFRRAQMREAIPASAITPFTHLAASLAVAVIVFLPLNQAAQGEGVSAGEFISFITALLMLISPVKQLTSISSTLQRGLVACENVFDFMDMAEEPDQGRSVLLHTKGQIEFKDVTFCYPGAQRNALDQLSFSIKPGQTVALVGASGSGKSTVTALLARFFQPKTGAIFIDGIDINEVRLDSLRSHIGLVSQDIVLFNDTVLANIAFGVEHSYSESEVIAAAKAANAWEFVQQLPQGLNTIIGEDGATLSGGQRQRLSIARALLKNPPILLLDEATSALDAESERLVQAALPTLMKGRTTLVIAHRLSTIEAADQIIVLRDGAVAESGTHQTLLAKKGLYANLHTVLN